MIITAKFASTCPCCHVRITPGSKVEWSKGTAGRAQSSTAGRYARPALRNGDPYTNRSNGMLAVFGCSDCTRLGRMCRSCEHDYE